MAQKKIQTLNELLRSTAKGASSLNKAQTQVDNYKKRLKNINDKTDPTDDRNALEKLLNLEKNQGFLRDFFEIIGRPQQALFTGLNEALQGRSFLEGAKEGFTGETDTYGVDLLETLGMETEEGKIDLADIGGFALDVFADPMDIPIIKAASKIKKATKAIDKVDDTLRLISPNQAIFQTIGKGIKNTAKGADNVITRALANSDAKVLNRAQILANESGELVEDVLKKGGKSYTSVENYNALKKLVKNTVNPSVWLSKLPLAKRAATAKAKAAADISGIKVQKLVDKTTDFVQKTVQEKGITNSDEIQKIVEDISSSMFRTIEASQSKVFDGTQFIKNLSIKSDTLNLTDESIDSFKKVLDKYGFKYKETKNGLRINKVNGSYNILKNNKRFLKDIQDLKLRKRIEITPESQEIIKNVRKFARENEDFKELYNAYKEIFPEIGDVFTEETGVKLNKITNKKGYVTHVETPEYARLTKQNKINKGTQGVNLTKDFASKKYPIADTANVAYRAKVDDALEKLPERIKELKSKTYDDILSEKEEKIVSLFIKKGVKEDKYAEKLLKKTKKIEKLKQNIANTKSVVNDISNSLTDNIISKMNKVKDKSLTQNLALSIADYKRTLDEHAKLLKKSFKLDLDSKHLDDLVDADNIVYEKLLKNKKRLDANITRISSYVDEETLSLMKRANDSVLKSEKTGRIGAKWEQKLALSTEDLNVVRQAIEDQKIRLDNQIQKAINDYEAFVGLGEKAFNEQQLKKIISFTI